MTPRALLLALLTCLLLAVGAPAAHAAGAECAGADVDPATATLGQTTGATLCLVNAERTSRGLKALTRDGRLDTAARRHTADMVERQYFAHRSPEGRHPADRIRAAGYLTSATAWVVGENLAWGTYDRGTPRAIVKAWMGSPGHRANILDRRYREIGLGVAAGNPVLGDGEGATYATTFGQVARARRARR